MGALGSLTILIRQTGNQPLAAVGWDSNHIDTFSHAGDSDSPPPFAGRSGLMLIPDSAPPLPAFHHTNFLIDQFH